MFLMAHRMRKGQFWTIYLPVGKKRSVAFERGMFSMDLQVEKRSILGRFCFGGGETSGRKKRLEERVGRTITFLSGIDPKNHPVIHEHNCVCVLA